MNNSISIVSYHAIQRFVDKAITPNDLRIYCYMRYRSDTNRNVTIQKIARDLATDEKAV